MVLGSYILIMNSMYSLFALPLVIKCNKNQFSGFGPFAPIGVIQGNKNLLCMINELARFDGL